MSNTQDSDDDGLNEVDQSAGDVWAQAELALAAGDYEEAVDLLTAYLASDPSDGAPATVLLPPQRLNARLMLGEAHLQLDRVDEARQAVAPLLDDKALSEEARVRLRVFDARVLEHEGSADRALTEAEALWDTLTERDDAGPEALAEAVELVARLLSAAERFDDALDACDLAANVLTDRPDFEEDPLALMAAARALETMGRVSVQMASADAHADDEASILERAAAALSVSLRFYEGAFGPGHPAAVGAWEAVGDVMERMGHTEEAAEARDTARDLLGG